VLVATHHEGREVDADRYDQSPDEEMLLDLTDQIGDFIPGLQDAGIQGQYCGVYSTTPDNDFIIDQVGPNGCYIACGFSGHGFKHGPAVGKILTDLVTVGYSDLVDTEYFSLDRFDGNPEGHGDPEDF
jgi:glycine/D-amino acid oxidase-like deaminating enzyme